MDVKELHEVLSDHFNGALLQIEGDDYHRLITIVSDDFMGLTRLARQQRVNKILFPFFQDGSLHAVTMKLLTLTEAS